ncbi:hypothetical protein [Acinetobacter baumannii]|uniref:hypothetical protein n=1 Tax=Acinetobacter baumannii TaxID=470 RepID=UPI0025A1454C|nr:hypothetical protein [Acinetobacter baumannii]
MASEIITRQELVDAKADAESLEKFISGTELEDVLTRLGMQYPTLAKAVLLIHQLGESKIDDVLNDLKVRYLALSVRGNWTHSTVYEIKDLVFVNNITYICLIDHTSSSNFQNDVNAGKWIVYQGVTQVDLQSYVAMNKTYAPVLGSPVKFKLNPLMASFLYGISDPTHKDDDLNNFRGLNNPDAYHDSNVAIGAVSFGRNNPPFAYLSLAGGHDCVPFGVASFVFGAGSCTGNPDDPVGSANGLYGYCSLSVGKNTQARGRISNAMGHLNLSESLYSSTDGYKCIAGASKTTDPDYLPDGTQGAAARAHGYQSEAYGNFAFSYGSFLKAFNGAQAIGKGIASGGVIQPLVISKRGVGIGYNVTKPTIFCKEGDGIDLERAWVGFNTDIPMSRYDYRYGESDTISHVIESTSGNGILANEVKGLLANGSYASLHNTIVSHPNAGQAYATIQHRLNGTEYMTVDPTRKVTFAKEIETSSGLYVAGKRLVGGQLPAILDLPASATLEDVIAKVNEILAALREGTGHGLIAP